GAMHGNARGILAGFAAAQERIGEAGGIELRRQPPGGGGILEVKAALDHLPGDGAVEEAGIEIGQAVMMGEALGERPLAGGGGPVNCDDHGAMIIGPVSGRAPPPNDNCRAQTIGASSNCAPRASMLRRKAGKLVAIGVMSSTMTGFSAARPR